MKVSAVIPTFNRKDYIQRSVESIFAQTVPVDEVIVVDDVLSTDNIAEAIDKLYGSRVKVVKEGGGLSGARRRGVQEASGDWIAFLDSDDTWAPQRNGEFLEAARCVSSDVAWILGDLQVVTDEGPGVTLFEEFGLTLTESPQVFSDSLSVQYPFQFGLLQGSFIRRSVLIELNCFSEGLQHSEDLLAGYQVACRYRFAAIPSTVGQYFRTSDLTENSAVIKGMYGADYFRSRMLCYELVIKSGRKRPWNRRYAFAVQGLSKVMARQGKSPRALAMQQFRFGGISGKGVAFLGAAMLGWRGIRMWDAAANFRRGMQSTKSIVTRKNGFQSSLESGAETNERAKSNPLRRYPS
jgi:glycosyltransferase involved in cell wall biosynthesis